MWSVMTRSDTSVFSSSLYFTPGNTADMLHDILHGIHLKEVVHPLHDAGQALQPHAGVDIGVLKRGVIAVAVAVKLGEDQVPELDIAVAVAADARSPGLPQPYSSPRSK